MMKNATLKVCVAQLGARRHYIVPRILAGAGMLERLYTDTYAGKFPLSLLQCLPRRYAPSGIRRLLGRKAPLAPKQVVAFQKLGFDYAQECRIAKSATTATAVSLEFGKRFGDKVVREGFGKADAVYAYRSAALEIFKAAKQDGRLTILDQTIAPKKIEHEILRQEYEAAPGWDDYGHDELLEAYADRERAEWELADIILCGSDFVRDGVVRCGGNPAKCRVVPTGTDLGGREAEERKTPQDRPLRILFVGQVGLRKGIRHFCQAMNILAGEPVECRVVGSLMVSRELLGKSAPDNMQIVGPVPRSEIGSHYEWADVFCLPSLCEGSALVVYEALAAGLPVITTPNSGSIVRNGVEGFVVPVNDAGAIASAIGGFLNSPEVLQRMSHTARLRASYGSKAAYAQRLTQVLTDEGMRR